ncbi:hypothetical protein BsWGS_12438 [Bradybaena similaris]
MGFRREIKIRFLVIMVIAAFVLGGCLTNRVLSSFSDQETNDSKDQSGVCPLPSMWGEQHILRSVVEGHGRPNSPFKLESGRDTRDLTFQMGRLLKYLFLDGRPEIVRMRGQLDDISVHQVSRRQEDTCPTETYLPTDDALLSQLSMVMLVLLIAHSSALAAMANHLTAFRKLSLESEKSNNIYTKALQFLSSSFRDLDIKSYVIKGQNCKDRRKLGWLDDPLRWTRQFLVYNVYSVLERVASYRPFAFDPTPIVPSAITLAEAGFLYPGVGTAVQCQGCRKLVEITSIDSPPTAAKYHRDGCSFVKSNSNLRSNEGYHNLDSATSEEEEVATSSEDEVATPNSLNTSNEFDEISTDSSETLPASVWNEQMNISPNKDSDIPKIQENVPACPETEACRNEQATHGAGNEHEFAQPLEQHSSRTSVSRTDKINATATCEREQMNQVVAGMTHQTNETATRENEQRSNVPAGMPQQTNVTATVGNGQRNQVPTDPPQQTNTSENMGASANPVNLEHTDPIMADAFMKLLFDPTIFDEEAEMMAADGRHLLETCTKNPGHYGNFGMQQLQLEHIPSNVRCPEMLQFIKLIGKLVVKLTIKTTSSKRPHISSEHREATPRCGTGMAFVKNDSEDTAPTEPMRKWNTIRRYLSAFKKNKGIINIKTNRHLIYDDSEAENTVVEFFFDNPNGNEIVRAKGVSVTHSPIIGDVTSFLKCKISDLSMVEFVKNTENEVNALVRRFPQRIKEGLTKRVFVISHPHGQEKVYSYGEYALVKYALKMAERDGQQVPEIVKINNHTQIPENHSNVRKMLFYTADTCKGSSGGLVVSFKKTRSNGAEEDIELELWMHSCVEKKHGLNASVMKELTSDDIANHGHTTINRPSVQDEQEAEADAASRQVVSGPVYTVIGPPAHPVYVTFMKRLGSYPTPFNHVHTATDLADAGFFFAGYADCVRCFQCGLGLRSWKPGDSIYDEHSKNRPDCQFLQMKMRANGIHRQGLQSGKQRSDSHASAQVQAAAQSETETCQNQLPNVSMTVTGSPEHSSEETGETQLLKATNGSLPPVQNECAKEFLVTLAHNSNENETKNTLTQYP